MGRMLFPIPYAGAELRLARVAEGAKAGPGTASRQGLPEDRRRQRTLTDRGLHRPFRGTAMAWAISRSEMTAPPNARIY